MSSSTVVLVLAVFGACAVESVEALTIVLASGVSRGWQSAIEGSIAAVVVLVVLVAAVGIPLARYVPLAALRTTVGTLLLVLGLGWLRKAVLRSSGHKALHDEDAIYAATVHALSALGPAPGKGRDPVGFSLAFKGVFLEGTEVVVIAVSLGSSSRHLGLASAAAGAAVLVVAAVGMVVARQLREVPENAMKFVVGVMLTSFGLYWVGEGVGLSWPGSDVFILALVALFLTLAVVVARWMRVPADGQANGAPVVAS